MSMKQHIGTGNDFSPFLFCWSIHISGCWFQEGMMVDLKDSSAVEDSPVAAAGRRPR